MCFLIALSTLILTVISLVFSLGGDAPSFFGNKIYVVKTGEFPLVAAGSAVIAEKPRYDTIRPGNIVIYQNSEKRAGLAEIYTAELSDDVYTYTAGSDRGTGIILSQGQVVGKAVKVSAGLGVLIAFAKSPAGVFVLAVLPSLGVIIFEISKFLSAKAAAAKAVRPVKKQDEIPTFIPRQKTAAVIDAYKGKSSLEDDYDMEEEVRRKNPAYRASELMGVEGAQKERPLRSRGSKTIDSRPPLVNAPHESVTAKLPEPKKSPIAVSQKRLNEVMAATNFKWGRTPAITEEKPKPPVVETVPIPTGRVTSSTPAVTDIQTKSPASKQHTPASEAPVPHRGALATEAPESRRTAIATDAPDTRHAAAPEASDTHRTPAPPETPDPRRRPAPPEAPDPRRRPAPPEAPDPRRRPAPPEAPDPRRRPAPPEAPDPRRRPTPPEAPDPRRRPTPPDVPDPRRKPIAPGETERPPLAPTPPNSRGTAPPLLSPNGQPLPNQRRAPVAPPTRGEPLPPPVGAGGTQPIKINRAAVPDKTAEIERVNVAGNDKGRRFAPKKQTASTATSSIPKLESILNDDNDNTRYNIEDILNSFDKR